MSEDKTDKMLRPPTFEERVLAQLDAAILRLAALEKRDAERDLETKPNWERILKDVAELHSDIKVSFSNLGRKLDVINSELLQIKADQKGVEVRLEKVELEVHPQIIVQERQF